MTQVPRNSLTAPTIESVIDHFWETFPPVWNCVREQIRAYVTANYDISVEQFHMLRHMRRGLQSTSELAAVKHISRPAASQAVDSLVSRGLVRRRQAGRDRRFVPLELTESGCALLDAVSEQNRRWMMERLSSLTPEEIEPINAALERLKGAFEED